MSIAPSALRNEKEEKALMKMNKEISFNYVFNDVLKYIENVEIVYQHEVFMPRLDDADGIPEEGSQWCLSLISIFEIGIGKRLYPIIAKNINLSINYIKENRLDLYVYYQYFIERLEERIEQFKNLQSGKIKLENLINQNIVIPKYLGYLAFNEHFHQRGVKAKPREAAFDEKDFDELHRMTRNYFDVLISEQTRLLLFLNHELNLSTTA